ncbi:MAG: carboxymuconolactone decarboxylase family protein [Myxococcaceae bacterium]|nr:carboxymuconolactone decarboxylase family protein [Myxococcaceae bacterium]
MTATDALRDLFPEHARDIKLNLQAVLTDGPLSVPQRWGVAVASAVAARNPTLTQALTADARAATSDALLDDTFAAASLMAMNNVYYRFNHLIAKPSYAALPARLRMNRLAKPATNRTDFELFSLAVSAINGCEVCIRSHEKVVIEGGLTEEQVQHAIRIAATVNAAAVALELVSADGQR